MPECAITLGHGVVYLATAPKDRRAYDALRAAEADVARTGTLEIPLKVRNAPTKLMKEAGYGKGYEQYDTKDFRPAAVQNNEYYPKVREKLP